MSIAHSLKCKAMADDIGATHKHIRPTCPHGRRKDKCKGCGSVNTIDKSMNATIAKVPVSANIGIQNQRCKDCGGSGICEHGRQQCQCIDCRGTGICEHGKHRSYCK